MRPARLLGALLALLLLLPTLLSARQACAMSGCQLAAAAHASCCHPQARLRAGCCQQPASPNALQPQQASSFADAAAVAPASAHAALVAAPPALALQRVESTAGPPPADLLPRLCTLRI